jgi:hypothetical protein
MSANPQEHARHLSPDILATLLISEKIEQKHALSHVWRRDRLGHNAIIRRDVVDLLHDIKFFLLSFSLLNLLLLSTALCKCNEQCSVPR